jgi:signal peptidase I
MRILLAALMLASLSVSSVLFGFRLYVDNSDSMKPTISAGDVVLIQRTSLSDMRAGDIVTAYVPDKQKLITHRITQINTDNGKFAVTTKGDANTGTEEWSASKNATVGKYVLKIAYIGYVVAYLKTIPGVITVMCIVAALLLVPKKIKSRVKVTA